MTLEYGIHIHNYYFFADLKDGVSKKFSSNEIYMAEYSGVVYVRRKENPLYLISYYDKSVILQNEYREVDIYCETE